MNNQQVHGTPTKQIDLVESTVFFVDIIISAYAQEVALLDKASDDERQAYIAMMRLSAEQVRSYVDEVEASIFSGIEKKMDAKVDLFHAELDLRKQISAKAPNDKILAQNLRLRTAQIEKKIHELGGSEAALEKRIMERMRVVKKRLDTFLNYLRHVETL